MRSKKSRKEDAEESGKQETKMTWHLKGCILFMHMCTWLKAVVSCVTWVLGAEVRIPVRATTITESSMQPLAELLTKCALKKNTSLTESYSVFQSTSKHAICFSQYLLQYETRIACWWNYSTYKTIKNSSLERQPAEPELGMKKLN